MIQYIGARLFSWVLYYLTAEPDVRYKGQMKKGSVIVDLASSTGGNVEGSKDREVVQVNGVTIIGNSSLASKMPEDASFLYSTNILNFVKILIKEGELMLDKENEIIRGAWFTEPVETEA